MTGWKKGFMRRSLKRESSSTPKVLKPDKSMGFLSLVLADISLVFQQGSQQELSQAQKGSSISRERHK